MSREIVLALGLHLVAMVAGAGLLLLALRSGTSEDREEDGGGGAPPAPAAPPDGPPLDGATRPARVRLREPARPSDLWPGRPRRPSHPPVPDLPRPAPSPRPNGVAMTYVINEPCIGTKDTSCVEVCPVDCIHPAPDEPGFEEHDQLYIDPEECIDCDACVEACPVDAITPEDMVPPEWQRFIAINAEYYQRARR